MPPRARMHHPIAFALGRTSSPISPQSSAGRARLPPSRGNQILVNPAPGRDIVPDFPAFSHQVVVGPRYSALFPPLGLLFLNPLPGWAIIHPRSTIATDLPPPSAIPGTSPTPSAHLKQRAGLHHPGRRSPELARGDTGESHSVSPAIGRTGGGEFFRCRPVKLLSMERAVFADREF